jgi:hypothetical protein
MKGQDPWQLDEDDLFHAEILLCVFEWGFMGVFRLMPMSRNRLKGCGGGFEPPTFRL